MAPTPGRGLSGNLRKLHMVGFSADHGGFILATKQGAKSGSYLLALDDTLIREIERARADDPRQQAPAPPVRSGVQSALTPREIQTRLRSGRTIEEVAAEAGATVDWVERFAAPVLAEQAAAVDRAGRSVLHTPRKGPSDRPLEASVRRNLADRGVAMGNDEWQDAWSARHLVDTDWLVSFRFRNRGRLMTAEWMLNLANGALTPRNRLGTELGYLDPGRRAAAAVAADGMPLSAPAPPARRLPTATKGAAVGRPGPTRAPVGKAAAGRPAVGKADAGKAAANRTAAGKPDAGKAGAGKAAAGKAAAGRTPAGKTVAPNPPAVRASAPKAGTPAAAARKAAPAQVAAGRAAAVKAGPARGAVGKAVAGKAGPTAAPANRGVASTSVEPATTDPTRRPSGAPAAPPAPPRSATAPAGAHFARPANGTRHVVPDPMTAARAPNGQQPHRPDRPLRANRMAAPPAEPPPRLFETDDASPDDGVARLGSQD